MHQMILNSNLVFVDGKIFKNRWGDIDEDFGGDVRMEMMKRIEQDYDIEYFSKEGCMLKLVTRK